MIKTILFDLDGTLLPMEKERFLEVYLDSLAEHMAKYGYEKQQFIKTIFCGINAMVKNDGTKTNMQAFWQEFTSVYGDKSKSDTVYFDDYYENYFDEVKVSCGFNPQSNKLIKTLKQMGYKLVLATNPLFPRVATQKRIKWAGLDENDFELVTVYENSCFSKPNIKYYEKILSDLNLNACECMMVGNDVAEDMIAEKLGLKVFLLTADLINIENQDISVYPQSDMNDLLEYIKFVDKK